MPRDPKGPKLSRMPLFAIVSTYVTVMYPWISMAEGSWRSISSTPAANRRFWESGLARAEYFPIIVRWRISVISKTSSGSKGGRPVFHVHLVGVAYKANVSDLRLSPALKLIELLRAGGAKVSYTDARVPALPEYGLESLDLDEATTADCVCIVTAHSDLDYDALAERAQLVVDLRNAVGKAAAGQEHVWKL